MLPALWEFIEGFGQGVISTMIFIALSRQEWSDRFGDGQHTPLDGSDGSPYTKMKYLGRVSGGGCLPSVIGMMIFITIVFGIASIFGLR